MSKVILYVENKRGELMELCRADRIDMEFGEEIRATGYFGGDPPVIHFLKEGAFLTIHLVDGASKMGRHYDVEVIKVDITPPRSKEEPGEFAVLMINRTLRAKVRH